jgi:hypothetical protein
MGMTCEQFQKVETERKDKALLEKNLGKLPFKHCPKCRTIIEKYAGCNAMKCTQCTIAFCWRCSMTHDDDGEYQMFTKFIKTKSLVFSRSIVHYHYNEKDSPCYNHCFDRPARVS